MYNLKVQVRDAVLKFRKWKVKDRNKYMAGESIRDALVYDCLEDKNIALSDEEYKYVLCKIREASVKAPITYTFNCDKCDKEFEFVAKLSEILTPKSKTYGLIESGETSFVMGSVLNRDCYNEQLASAESESEVAFIDFVLHIHSYNNNDALTFDEMLESINNLDIDIFESIFKQWEETRFTVDSSHGVKCTHCGNIETYEFDDCPGFFPSSWSN